MPSLLYSWQQQKPDTVALVAADNQITWAQLYQQTSLYQSWLASQGVTVGDVVAVIGNNCLSSVLIYLACIESGATFAPIADGPQSVIEQKLATIDPVLVIDLKQDIDAHSYLDGTSSRYSQQALSSLIFTSGSSGFPKAVAHNHANHIASAMGLLQRFKFEPHHSWLLSLPLYHVSGLSIIWRWLVAGAKLVMASGDLLIDLSRVTHASLVVTQLQRALNSGSPLILERVLLGGSHIPPELCQQAQRHGIDTWLGYGMTEAASTVTAKRADGNQGAGVVLPNRKLTIRGERILIGGDTLAQGYYQQGRLNPIADKHGWFDSKDLGKIETDQLHVIGRADNQFISGGENIHCEEIEAVLAQHPKVAQVVVIPMEDEEYGHRAIALIDAKQPWQEQEFEQWCLKHLDRFKRPKSYLSMPKLSLSGIKVSRHDLKAWLIRYLEN
ncbi:o-succinylbenzoate--CoA ligase [Vibrio sp. SCSIO 43136]|uniref:o-succinylbenzoate--CoA ligase n=1 Tax=Vibrio sp. SCSIO 43136 TaxID=2819101 RepID=UPI002074DB11|nr:o-succinylbenzoate--CoA ligase [Vibrio sp. SCSIO 43136]USD64455.1 o-succinylbenzoate--CoA ligase [Vibrio sp. SCSIO 43136]